VCRYLYGFEEYCRSACIVFRTIHHNEARPVPQPSQSEQKAAQVPEVKVKDKDKVGKGPTPPVQNESAAATEDKPSQEEAESGSESDKESHKDIASPRVRSSQKQLLSFVLIYFFELLDFLPIRLLKMN
jgi:AT-rich interactive domain-containing protein 4A